MAPASLELRILLVGFGNVARRFARLLGEREAELRGREGLVYQIVGISTGHHGYTFSAWGVDVASALSAREAGQPLPSGTKSAAGNSVEFIRRACAECRDLIVVETTPLDVRSGQPAIDHIRTALEGGADVVTANKGPVAFAYRELQALADGRGRSFLFEGTVMDGIPIFNLVRETLPAVRINAVRGVVNSTTNHILTEMERGKTLDVALREMQQAGIAEADSSLDVEGWDAAAKIAALSNVFLDGQLTPHDVERQGITGITNDDVERAKDKDQRIRLVAEAERHGGGVVARVQPQTLGLDSPLARLVSMQNALILSTDLLGDIAITQLDGGLTQTAYALLSDLVRIARRRRR
jgi:homoserine dehydrogenase